MRFVKAAKDLLEWSLICPVFRMLQLLPEKWAYRLARLGGRIAYYLSGRSRHWCHTNMKLAYGNRISSRERQGLAIGVFEHLAITIVEVLRMDRRWLAERVLIDGHECLEKLLKKSSGKGLIAVGAHLGNWEVLGGYMSQIGFQSITLSRPIDNHFLENELKNCRSRYGTEGMPRNRGGVRAAIKRFRAGDSVAFAMDLNTAHHGTFVDFMGVPASSARGAAKLAIQENSPAVLIVSFRLPDGRHQIVVEPIPISRTGNLDHDIQANTQSFVDRLTTWIHRYPEQWQWQHPRWRTRPDGSDWTERTSIETMLAERNQPFAFPTLPWTRKSRNEASSHLRFRYLRHFG